MYLDEHRFEGDFGIRAAINALDDTKLKRLERANLGDAMRAVALSPFQRGLTSFGLDDALDLIRKISGRTRDDANANSMTGSRSLRVTGDFGIADLPDLAADALDYFNSDDYQQTQFAILDSVMPVPDRELCEELDELAAAAIRDGEERFELGLPIGFDDQAVSYRFKGPRLRGGHPDLLLRHYTQAMGERLPELTAEILRSHRIVAEFEDDTPAPGFAINDVSVTEGGTLSFTVTKTGSTSSSFSVDYATANVTAIAGSDYTAASGTLTFAAAETTKPVTVSTIDDTTVESSETLYVNLSGATGGATITDSQGVGTINDNDTAATCNGVSFAIGNAADTEGNGLAFAVTKSGTASISCSVSYATADGTAVAPGDYTATSGTLAFAASETTKYVSVTTLINAPGESNETLYVNLSNPTNGSTISDSQGVGTLYDYYDEGGGGPGGGGGGCPITCR